MAATDKVLGKLHEAVANELTRQVTAATDCEGDEKVAPSPALLSAAIAFLKNNNVTADAEENEALRALNDQLAARRQRKVPQSTLDQAATAYAATQGVTLQ